MKMIFIAIVMILLDIVTSQQTGVRGTRWAPTTDSGGCQMPDTEYLIPDAVALGQGTYLGPLIYRSGLCGQVLDITCDGGGASFPAVIASTCNIGSGTCGIDMIDRTWSKATGGASPGVTSCTVALSTAPLMAGAAQCFHRMGSAFSAYSRILGIFNTKGEIPKSATLAGKPGISEPSSFFEFNSGGAELFVDSALVVFTYESGNTATFNLGQCSKSSTVHIWS